MNIRLVLALATACLALGCEAVAPEVDTLGPGLGADPAADFAPADDVPGGRTSAARPDAAGAPDGAAEVTAGSLSSRDLPRVRAILPDGRVVLLRDRDVMPGRFVARNERFRVSAAVWADQ